MYILYVCICIYIYIHVYIVLCVCVCVTKAGSSGLARLAVYRFKLSKIREALELQGKEKDHA